MDTKARDIAQSNQEQLERLLTSLKEDAKNIEQKFGPFFQQLEEDVSGLQLVSEVKGLQLGLASVSKEDCISAAKEFRELFKKLMDFRKPEYQSFLKQLQHLVNVYDHVWKRYDIVLEQTPKDKMGLAQLRRNLHRSDEDQARALKERFLIDEEKKRAVLFQAGLQKLVEGLDDDLRKWYWKQEMSGFGGHVKPMKTRPVVDLDFRGNSESLIIPADIMSLIFAATDIDTCVELREVSKDWYAAFHDSEGVLERKLSKRNLWIKPGDDDLQSWADCVLVFVRRLQSGKWSTVAPQELSVIQESAQAAKRMTVVGSELDLDEKLPSNFSGMFDKPDQLSVRTQWYGVEYHVDPWTRRSRKAYIPHKVLREDEEGTVISHEGVEITLDPSIRAGDIQQSLILLFTGSEPLQPGRHTVQVLLNNDKAFVAPRDKPHFDHGMIFETNGDGTNAVYEVGDLAVYRRKLGHQHYSYYLLDLVSKNVALVSERALPVASYNGNVWCSVGNSLVPTFVDLKTPGITYYRTDRAISGIDRSSSFRQCSKARGLGQFVLSEPEESTVVVDLASGVLTTLQQPPGWDKYTTVIPGFLDGAFHARCMKSSVLNVIRESVLREHGVGEREI